LKVGVCVKRVPETGARITLTSDDQAIDTSLLGFTISPHEECAVEEALRIAERHGGSTTVLTLGPAAASAQLQNARARGMARAARGRRGLGDLRAAAAGGRDREGRDQPAALRIDSGSSSRKEDTHRTDPAAAARKCARDDQARRASGTRDARRGARRRRRCGAARRRSVPRARAGRTVILCLVDDDPVSLEALTFARRFGEVEALVFGDIDVGGYVARARRVVHARLDEYAPTAWAQAVLE